MDHLRFPIGEYTKPSSLAPAERDTMIEYLTSFPEIIRELTMSMTDQELNTPYRPGGWTAKEVINHVADSHTNAYIRLKLSLTEETPTIKPYNEKLWVSLPDIEMPITTSLQMIQCVHDKMTFIFRNLTPSQWGSQYYHPGSDQHFSLNQFIALYYWHSRHHLGHLQIIKNGSV